MDSNSEWIALLAFAFTLIGGLANIVWMLAQMRSEIQSLNNYVRVLTKRNEEHCKECDEDRVKMTMLQSELSRRINILENLHKRSV